MAISAKRLWLVQILDVAFSRRMCCSRVERVVGIASLAFRIDGLSDEPPGQVAQEPLSTGEKTDVRSAEA